MMGDYGVTSYTWLNHIHLILLQPPFPPHCLNIHIFFKLLKNFYPEFSRVAQSLPYNAVNIRGVPLQKKDLQTFRPQF